MTVPNQRIVKIHKENKQKAPFLSLSVNLMAAVYNDLKNASSFFLYVYFCCNTDNYCTEFSPAAISQKFGFPKSTARDHFNILVDKGYLVQRSEESNIYDFYSEPKHLKVSDENFLNEFLDFS